jgi:hypothetical protein
MLRRTLWFMVGVFFHFLFFTVFYYFFLSWKSDYVSFLNSLVSLIVAVKFWKINRSFSYGLIFGILFSVLTYLISLQFAYEIQHADKFWID